MCVIGKVDHVDHETVGAVDLRYRRHRLASRDPRGRVPGLNILAQEPSAEGTRASPKAKVDDEWLPPLVHCA